MSAAATTVNGSFNSSQAAQPDTLYLENHYAMMVLTVLVIGSAAVIGTFGNILVRFLRHVMIHLQ